MRMEVEDLDIEIVQRGQLVVVAMRDKHIASLGRRKQSIFRRVDRAPVQGPPWQSSNAGDQDHLTQDKPPLLPYSYYAVLVHLAMVALPSPCCTSTQMRFPASAVIARLIVPGELLWCT